MDADERRWALLHYPDSPEATQDMAFGGRARQRSQRRLERASAGGKGRYHKATEV